MADTDNPDGADAAADVTTESGNNAANTENNAADKGGDGSDDKSGDDKSSPTTPKEPVVRNNSFHAGKRIGERQAKQASQSDNDGGDDGNGSDAGNDKQQVTTDPRLDSILENQQRQDDDREIDQVLNKHPQLKEYADQVRNYAKHPSRANVPIDSLFLEVVGIDRLLEMGAAMGTKSKAKQDDSAVSGDDNQAATADKNINDMTDAEFKAYQDKVRTG